MSNTINGIKYVKYDPKMAGVKPYYIAMSGGRLKYTNTIGKNTTIKDFNKPVKYDKPTNRLLVGAFNFDPFSKEYTKQFQDIEAMLKYSGGMIYRTEVVNNPPVNIGNDEQKKDDEKKENDEAKDKDLEKPVQRRKLNETTPEDDTYKKNISEDNILYYHQPTSSIGKFTLRGEVPFLVIKRSHGLYMKRLVPDWKNKTGDDRFYKYPDNKDREYEIKRESNTANTQYSRQQYSVDKEIVNGKDAFDIYRDQDLGGKDHEYHFGEKMQTKGFFGPKLKDDELISIEEKKEKSKAVYTSKEQQREALDRIKKAQEDEMKKREEQRKKDQEKRMDNVEGPGDFKPLDKTPPKPQNTDKQDDVAEPSQPEPQTVEPEPRKLEEEPVKDLGDATGNLALQGEAVDLIDPEDVNLNVVDKIDEFKIPDKEIKEVDLKKPNGLNFTTGNFDRLKTSFNIDRFLPEIQKLTFQQYYNKLMEEHPRKLQYFLDETDIYLNSFYQFLSQLEDTVDVRDEDLYQYYGDDQFKNVSRGVPIIKNPNLIEQDDVDYSFDDKYLPEMLNGIFMASLMFSELSNEKIVLKDDDDVIVETYLNHTEDALKSRVAKKLIRPNKMELTQFKFIVIMTLVGIFSLRKRKAGPKRLRNIVARVINNIPYTRANLEQQEIDNVFETLQRFYGEHPYPFNYGQLSQFYEPIIEYLYRDKPNAQFNYFFRHVEEINKLVPAIEEKFNNRQSLKEFILNLYEKQKESKETFKDFNRYTRGMRRLLFEDFAKNFEDGTPIFDEIPKGSEYEITNERTGEVIERVFIPYDENKKAVTLFINEEGRFYESREDDRADTQGEMGFEGQTEEMPLGTINPEKELPESIIDKAINKFGSGITPWIIGRIGIQVGKLLVPSLTETQKFYDELAEADPEVGGGAEGAGLSVLEDLINEQFNLPSAGINEVHDVNNELQEYVDTEGNTELANLYNTEVLKRLALNKGGGLLSKFYINVPSVEFFNKADFRFDDGTKLQYGQVPTFSALGYDVRAPEFKTDDIQVLEGFGKVGRWFGNQEAQWTNLRFELVEYDETENILPAGFNVWKQGLAIARQFLGKALIPTNIVGQPWIGINPIFIPTNVLLIPLSYYIMKNIVPYFRRTPLDRLRERNEQGEFDVIDLSIGKPLPFKNKDDLEILQEIITNAESIPFPKNELKQRQFKDESIIPDIFGSRRPANWQDIYMADTIEPFMEKYSKFMTYREKYVNIARFVISGQAYHQNFDQRLYTPNMNDLTMSDLLKVLSDEADRVVQTPSVYKVSNPDARKFWAIFEVVPFRYRKALYDHFQFTYEDMEDARELLNRKDFIGTLDKDEFLADEMPKYEQDTIDEEHRKDVNLGTEVVPSIADYRYLKLSKLAYKVNAINKNILINEAEVVNKAYAKKIKPEEADMLKLEQQNDLFSGVDGNPIEKKKLYKLKLEENDLASEFNINNPEYYTDGDRDFILIKEKDKDILALAVAGSKTNPSEAGFARDWKTNIFGTFMNRAAKIMNLLEPMLKDGQTWYISGHSLGSATGNLLALRIGRQFNSNIHYVGFATPGCLLADKVKLYSETLKNGLYKNYYIYNDVVGKISVKMVVPEDNNFVLYKNGWKEVGLKSTFFNQIQKVIATVRDNAHSIDLYHKYLRIAVKRGELKRDTYESREDILLNFDRGVFLEKHPDINPPILSRILAREPLLRRRIRITKKMNPRKSAEDILDIVIYEEARKIVDRIQRNKKPTKSRQERLFPEGDQEPKKEKPQFTDFSNTVPEPEGGWLSWSKTISNLFSGKDEL
jgi:hypothetical protein